MKVKRFRRLTALLCSLALMLALSPSVLAAGSPAVSDNSRTGGYGILGQQHWAEPVTSYLFENAQGGLTRVEYIKAIQNGEWAETIVVEDYSPSFQLLSSRTVPMELSIWGGFFAGAKYNFLIFGQDNLAESDSVEVIRVVKYDKSWNRLGQASLYGAHTYRPIRASSVDCAEYGDVLYVRTGHEMYKSSDGKNHQANMMFTVQESTMTIPSYNVDPSTVSHSFKQLILIDSEGNILSADHGDGSPRAFRLAKYPKKAGALVLNSQETYGGISGDDFPDFVDFQKFPGQAGDNTTGGKLLGLEEVTDGYLLTYIYRSNVYLAYIAKKDLTWEHDDDGTAKITQITNNTYGSKPLAAAAAMVSTGLSGGYVLWTNFDLDRVYYAGYSADGSVGETHEITEGRLSDCQPIVYNGKVVWYQTEKSVPTFFSLDASGCTVTPANGTAYAAKIDAPAPAETEVQPALPHLPSGASGANLPFTDVAADSPYRDAIAWAVEHGITNGTSPTTFSPSATCTQGQIMTFLYRAAGSPNKGGDEWDSVRDWAGNYYITYAARNTPCNRITAVTYLWLAQGKPQSNLSVSFTDIGIKPEAPQYGAIPWAVEQGITNGTSPTTFSPVDLCTRGQIVTFLYRCLA